MTATTGSRGVCPKDTLFPYQFLSDPGKPEVRSLGPDEGNVAMQVMQPGAIWWSNFQLMQVGHLVAKFATNASHSVDFWVLAMFLATLVALHFTLVSK